MLKIASAYAMKPEGLAYTPNGLSNRTGERKPNASQQPVDFEKLRGGNICPLSISSNINRSVLPHAQ